jgi:hypothetical protein
MPVAKGLPEEPRVIRIKALHVKNAEILAFPTIITQFEDKWNPEWKAETVYGRMDPFAFYAGTRRELTLGFRVVSDDEKEAQINMTKLQRLIQYQYPSFQSAGASPVSTLKAPPYFSLEIMNIAKSTRPRGTKGLQGYFSSAISINPGFQDKNTPQYFNEGFNVLSFSDVQVTLRMVILHAHEIGFYKASSAFAGRNIYPYSIGSKSPGDTKDIHTHSPSPLAQQAAGLAHNPPKPLNRNQAEKGAQQLNKMMGPSQPTHAPGSTPRRTFAFGNLF